MTRRVLGLSKDAWRLILVTTAVVVWWLVFVTDPLFANDCIDYIKKPTNFATIPKSLIEDCMRTGTTQAAVTAATAAATAAAIAAAVTKAITGGSKNAPSAGTALGGTVTAGVGDTPGTGDGDPNTPPEGPGGQQTRDGTPEACRSIWDDLQTAIADVKQTEYLVETCQKHLQKAIDNKQNNLAKVTIQLGADAANAAAAGAGGVKGAMGIARGIAEAPEFLAQLANAASRASSLGEALENVLREISTITGNIGRFSAEAAEAGRLSAAAESKIADLVKVAAGLEGESQNFEELVGFARTADSTLMERNAVEASAAAAEQAIADAQAEREAAVAERAALEEWAESERVAINSENQGALRAKQDELGTARSKVEAMKAEHAEEAKAAHADWQAKMDEVRDAKLDLEEARAQSAHTAKARTDVAMAEQDVRRTSGVLDDASTRLEHAEGDLAAFEENEAIKQAIPQLEEQENALSVRVSDAEDLAEAKVKFNKASDIEEELAKIDGLKAALDDKSAATSAIENKLEAFDQRPDFAGYQAEIEEAQGPLNAARAEDAERTGWKNLVDDERRVLREELERELESHGIHADSPEAGKRHGGGLDPSDLGPDREAYYAAKEADINARYAEAVKEMKDAEANVKRVKAETDQAVAAINERHNQLVKDRAQVVSELDAARVDEHEAIVAYRNGSEIDGRGNFDPARHEQFLAPYREQARTLRADADRLSAGKSPDPEPIPQLKEELKQVQADLAAKKYKAAEMHGTSRDDLQTRISVAKNDVNTATAARQQAETRLADAKTDLHAADTDGLGQPLDTAHRVEAAQAKYQGLIQQQEALRAKYDQLASGAYSNPTEAAALRARMEQLETEINNWKEPDYGSEMRKRDPGKYQEYMSVHADKGKIPAIDAKIESLTTQVKDAQAKAATLGQTLATLQAKTGGESVDALQAKLNQAKTDLAAKQGELASAKTEKQTQDQAAVDCDAKAKDAQAQLAAAQARKADIENQKRQADEDLRQLQYKKDHPDGRPDDASGVLDHLPGAGGEWTPYKGSAAEDLANKSHSLRQRLDDNYEATTPQWEKDLNNAIKAPFKWAGKEAGDAFHWAFGGSQSPEEVAAILKNDVAMVDKYSSKLQELQDQYKTQIDKAKSLQNDLDVCKMNNA